MTQIFIHYFLHLVFPVLVALLFYRKPWVKVSAIFLLTMLVDVDHLFANRVFELCRCSIGFHPLHSYWAIGVYILGVFHPKTRLVAIGLLMHMATDLLDCYMSTINCR